MCRNWGDWLNLLTGITYPLPTNSGYFQKTQNSPIIITEGPYTQIPAGLEDGYFASVLCPITLDKPLFPP